MFKKSKILFCLALAAATFTSCSDQDDAIQENKATPITFVSGLGNYTRISQDGGQWVADDQVGIYMVATGQTTASDFANVPYKAEASADVTAFKPVGDVVISYPEDESAVDFIAYYPYTASLTNMTYAVNVADQSASLTAHDLLYAKANNNGSGYTQGSVSFSFKHQLSKIIMNFIDEEGTAITPDANGVTIKGMNTTANFDLKTGVLSDAATVANIAPYKNSKAYEAVILPFSVSAGHEIIIRVNTNTYKWTMNKKYADLEIKPGYSYTFNITVNAADAEMDAVLVDYNGNSISPWEDGAPDAKPEEPTDPDPTDPEEPAKDLDIPADFTKVELKSGESISAAIGGASGKVAIILPDGGKFDESAAFKIPETVTSLIIAGKVGTTQPAITFNNMEAKANLDLVHLYNVEVSGDAASHYFINQGVGVTFKEIIIENSYIHDLRGIIRVQKEATAIESYKVLNCIVDNINNYCILSLSVDGATAASIELSKSTFTNLAGRGINYDKATTQAGAVVVDQCTFNQGPFYAIVQFNATPKGTLTFTNNIVGMPYNSERGVSVLSNGTMEKESGNYYVKNTTWQGDIAVGTDCGFTDAELFKDAANKDFTQSKLQAGDPRWY